MKYLPIHFLYLHKNYNIILILVIYIYFETSKLESTTILIYLFFIKIR